MMVVMTVRFASQLDKRQHKEEDHKPLSAGLRHFPARSELSSSVSGNDDLDSCLTLIGHNSRSQQQLCSLRRCCAEPWRTKTRRVRTRCIVEGCCLARRIISLLLVIQSSVLWVAAWSAARSSGRLLKQQHQRGALPEDDQGYGEGNEESSTEESRAQQQSLIPGFLTDQSFLMDAGERRPIRNVVEAASVAQRTTSYSNDEPLLWDPTRPSAVGHDWGIHRQDENTLSFPQTVDQVAQGAAEAIAFTLTQQQQQQQRNRKSSDDVNVDPHLLANLWAGDRYWQDRRPVRRSADGGRLGIEIDDNLLFHDSGTAIHPLAYSDDAAKVSATWNTVRSVSLALAGKLSNHSAWNQNGDKKNGGIPVVVYLNTVKQALAATSELTILKHLEQQGRGDRSASPPSCYDNVSILSLGQQGDVSSSSSELVLPSVLLQHNNSSTTDRAWRNHGTVDPASRGMIVVVQPTDLNQEYRPPGPAFGCVSRLQKLVAQAALFGIAVVVVSPRFCSLLESSSGVGWDQSGYQQSASFGGMEPPNGPTPWLLRDFGPPVYSWVGNVVQLERRHSCPQEGTEARTQQFYYSGVSMIQSILHRQRAWHVFAEQRALQRAAPSLSQRRRGRGARQMTRSFEYLASTKSSAGRPTRDICLSIWQEFASFSPNIR